MLDDKEAESDELRERLSEFEDVTKQLEEKYAAAFTHLEQEAEEKIEEKVAELEARLAEIEEKDADIENANREIEKLGQQVFELEDEIDKLRAESAHTLQNEAEERERLEALVAALKDVRCVLLSYLPIADLNQLTFRKLPRIKGIYKLTRKSFRKYQICTNRTNVISRHTSFRKRSLRSTLKTL